MDIDRGAPVVSKKEIVVAASPERTWSVLADIEKWPAWHAGITRAELDGPLAPGSTFTWKSGPGTITSRLGIVEPYRLLGWSGRSMGTRAVHVWRLEPDGDGTRVVTEESMAGRLVGLLKRSFQKVLEGSLDAWLEALKTEVEARL